MNKYLIECATGTDGTAIMSQVKVGILNKKHSIIVPKNYVAVCYIDEKPCFRIEPCGETEIVSEYGKDYLGKSLTVFYVYSAPLAPMLYGFGNIQVNNERLKEAYRVGANGKLVAKVSDYVKLISSFSAEKLLTVDMLREKVLGIIKTIGVPVVSACFVNTSVSVFEISSMIEQIRDDITAKLAHEPLFSGLGIMPVGITIDGLFVNEDDLETIRKRLNA